MSEKPDPATDKVGTTKDEKPNTDAAKQPKELGGRKGPEPTRYGDWEKNGIISDF